MRKLTMLAVAGFGAWAGWNAARSTIVSLLLPRKSLGHRRPHPVAATRGATQDVVSPSEAVEKVLALLELSRERGIEVVQSVLRSRIGRAA